MQKTKFFLVFLICFIIQIAVNGSLLAMISDIPQPLPIPQPPVFIEPSEPVKTGSFLDHFMPENPTAAPQPVPVQPAIPKIPIAPIPASTAVEKIIKTPPPIIMQQPKESQKPEVLIAENKPEEKTIVQKPVEEEAVIPPFEEEYEQGKPDIYLASFLKPWEFGDQHETIQLEFENAELSYFISYIEKRFGLTFIMDDSIKPTPQGGKSALGTKITFRTQQPLTKKEVWNIFITLLDMAGLATQPGPSERIYRITTSDPKSPLSVNRSPLPTFIGVNPDLIPNNETRIRYIYFVTNTSLDVIKNVVDSMKSATSAPLIIFPELRAIIMTDKASNIKSMLNIMQELDKVNMPETLAVVKLKHTDAVKVAELYKSLMQESQQPGAPRPFPSKKQSSLTLFNEGVRAVIPEPRQNYLILLGTRDAIKKIEEFIVTEIDRQEERQFAPLHVIQLKYVEAEAVAAILQEAVQFQPETEAAKYGSVRNGDKYFKAVYITPEKTGNRLIINAEYEDYLKIFELIQKIDIEQPQVGIKVLILEVDVTEDKELGIQLRNRIPGPNGLLGNNVNFQTSGLAGIGPTASNPNGGSIVENPNGTGATRLLGNIINIISQNTTPGSTLLTLGSDSFGVWGLLRVLQENQRVSVVANPFLVTTHKYPAIVSFGETKRVVTATTFVSGGPQNSFANLSANLQVNIEPQISYEGLITLQVRVLLEQFNTAAADDNGNRTKREVKTSVLVADNEVLALGGLMRDEVDETETKVPILGDIPFLGWLFKNKVKITTKSSLLILISAEIIPPYSEEFAQRFTDQKIRDNKELLLATHTPSDSRDPLHRWFFKDPQTHEEIFFDEFAAEQERYVAESQLPALLKKRKKVSKKERRKRQARKTASPFTPQGVAA